MEIAPQFASNDSQLYDVRICHLVGNLGIGGAERQIANLLGAMAHLRPLLILIDRNPAQHLVRSLPAGVEVICSKVSLSRWPRDIGRIASIIRAQSVEILHSHMFWPSFHAAAAAGLARVPVMITTEHGRNPWKKRWHRWVERNVISRRAVRRICVSQDIMNLRIGLDHLPPSQLVVIPNGTSIPNTLRPSSRSSPTSLLAVGRLVAAKDYSGLLNAARVLVDRHVRFELQIAGDGPLRNELRQQCTQLGLDSQVRFLGNRADVPQLMNRSDIFVLSSEREGQPMVLLEAMARAMPIVATRVGGIPETLSDGVEGRLVPARNPGALADALQFSIEHPVEAEKWGQRARERVKMEFSIETIAQRHLELYRNALDAVRS